MPNRIIIIGASAAGVDAASAVRKKDRSAEVTLLTQEKHAGYSRCGLPFVIGGQIPAFKNLIVYPPAYFQLLKLNLKTETTVTAINTKDKTVTAVDNTGNVTILPYDKLIIATGGYAFMPPIKGSDKSGIYTLRTLEDGEKIDQAVKGGAKTAVIMGAGLIGLETGVALVERGLQVTIVEMLPHILPNMLDADMAKQVQAFLSEKGIRFLTGRTVREIIGETKAMGIIADDEQINADIVMNAFGVRANTKLAVDSGIPLGECNAIKTNSRMETPIKDVYAVGDCAETINFITKKPLCAQIGTVAVKQGKVAGINAAGGDTEYLGAIGSAVTKLFDTEIGVTGLTEAAAQRAGIETIAGSVSSKTKAEYYPNALPIKIKLVAEKATQRIIGAQIIGGEEVTQRINAISIAIQNYMTLQQLTKADTAYTPPLCETWEPLITAAEVTLIKHR
jgi:NADH oxidase (H2O2-forming)